MKRFALLISVLLSAGGLMAQSTIETVYLKNGGLVKGEIIEQVPGLSLKVKTKDGNIFVYKMDEVERITKETQTGNSNERHRGLDLGIDLGYNLNTKGGGGSLAAELEIGKRFSKSFYWGIGSGAFIPTNDGDPLIPFTTDFKVFMSSSGSNITPYVGLKAGYVLNTASDEDQGSGRYSVTVEMPDYIMVQIMPGIQFPLSKTIDLNLGAGYVHFLPAKGSGSSGALAMRAGFGFHKATGNQRKQKAPKAPLTTSQSNVLQLTIEANSNPYPLAFQSSDYDRFAQIGMNAVLSYKVTNTAMLGVGAGFGYYDCSEPDLYSEDKYYVGIDGYAIKAFARGLYRFSDRRFSPFISCDLGMRYNDIHGGGFLEGTDKSKSCISPYVTPAVGLSLRASQNSYLDLTAGYDYAPKKSWDITEYDTSVKYETGPMSAAFIRIGFTRTFAK